ncbi:MAG: succinate dehydrogenase/fumarate reductase iron-sulfur subunit [Pseudanabaenaceae cyanobacterium SKYGB_i_bin29]|nr:succinate dehydrogenase/fumarate reductase iron-sulfur subunit [Pseudanabaenaceae cyanobacterium SKYG29]MDW8421885.1 succinate dehydrogenase/fumarate reductase iron-sulfur subunit [Pseudanabaenaceae cyanobacterium SKYGB_i_bin29]
MEVTLRIRRQSDRGCSPYWQVYRIDLDPRSTVLDALHHVQWYVDGTLAFRRNCRNVICGSCGMQINHKAGLACQVSINEVQRQGEVVIAPLGNFPVIKDLIVDLTPFWQDLQRVNPYIAPRARQPKESLQTPAQRARIATAANCILCGACYSACNVKEVNPQFVAPHALARAQRVLQDNRDCQTTERLQKYHHKDFVWGCTRCFQCNEVCPVGVQPLDRITEIKQTLLQDKNTKVTTPIRHRQVLLKLVKRSGWLDEMRFALLVVNWFSLMPLGLRLLWAGKFPFPWHFQPSRGKEHLQELVEILSRR